MPKPQDVKRLNENTRAKASAVKLEVAVSVISGYEPGKGEGAKTKAAAFKLSSNENPLGASVRALKALRATRVPSERYPDSRLQAVKSSVAEAYGLDASNLVFGNGSDELSALVCTLFLAPGDEAIAGEHSFLLYRSQVLAAGGVPVLIRERAHKLSVADVAACASRKTKLVFVTSPANPMGAILTRREVLALARKLPAGCALLVDMAYADYVVDDRHVFTDVKAGDNVVFTHTLSKLYGLAHLRVGWMHAPARYALAANKIKSPFNVNGVAQALACAAVEDGGHKALSASFNMF